ncbi:MAG: MFS transporter [Raoultibacter sp.]
MENQAISEAPLSESKASSKPFYGRKLILILGLVYFCSSGFILPAANIINPIMLQDPSMGLNGTLLGIGFSLFILFQGISAPLVGGLVARKGVRFSMVVGATIMVISSIVLIFFVKSPIMYVIFFGVTVSVGTMMAGQLAVQSTIGEWFIARRGTAMTAMMIIGASAALIAPPLVDAVITATGGQWQSGWYLYAGLSIFIIPIAIFLVKNKPSDIGQFPDGAASTADLVAEQKDFKVYKNVDSVPFSKAIRTRTFWLISLAATGGFAAYSLASSQGVIHFTTLGFDRDLIVGGVALMGGAGLVGKILMGSVSDHIEPVRLISISAILLAVGILAASFATNAFMVYVFYFCIGFGFGAVSATFPTAMANYFGAGSFSKNLGTGIFITTIVASSLPILSGAIFDATGQCTYAFFIAAAIMVVCALCGLLVKFPNKNKG